MNVLRPTTDTTVQYVLRAGVLVLVCALGGAYDVLNNSFAMMAARVASFPEEEEHVAKDRAALVAAAQPARKGSIRPRDPAAERVRGRHACLAATPSRLATSP